MKFFHIRAKHVDGTPKPTGGITIGYERLDDKGKELLVTFARCSERDIFNKAKARLICEGRMRKGVKTFSVVVGDKDRYQTLFEEAAKREKTFEQKRKEVGIKHRPIL